ncbi:hypothetical protein [Nocardioides sp. B-3]|uniref:hypothetical protein n=1 Tax=Nocardioides sp. B-3 TaxID=2895565 RepID=UPI0021533816|nr:hypothetical protein [Nocardioides sp. B-3]UUZ60187.1 hypothetical protein LP418_04400 [Nocardioides sp. B-3]
MLVRALVALALLVVGAGGGLAAALVHGWWWGLALGLAAATLTTLALPAGGWRFAFMLGWFGAIAYVVLPRAEGDYLIPSSTSGYGLLGGSFPVFRSRWRPCRIVVARREDPGVSPPVT